MKDIIVSGYPGKLAKAVIKELELAPELLDFLPIGLSRPTVTFYDWNRPIAAVINCIGAYTTSSVLKADVWSGMLASNLYAPLEVIMSALPHMTRGGLIINVTAQAAFRRTLETVGHGAYVGSKLAMSAATLSLRAELQPAGIEVEDWQAPTMVSSHDYAWQALHIVSRVIRTLTNESQTVQSI